VDRDLDDLASFEDVDSREFEFVRGCVEMCVLDDNLANARWVRA